MEEGGKVSTGRWTEPGDGSQQPGKGNPEPAGLLPGLLPEASASGHTVHSPLLEHLFARNSVQNAPGFSHHLKCSSVLEPLIPIHFPAARAQMPPALEGQKGQTLTRYSYLWRSAYGTRSLLDRVTYYLWKLNFHGAVSVCCFRKQSTAFSWWQKGRGGWGRLFTDSSAQLWLLEVSGTSLTRPCYLFKAGILWSLSYVTQKALQISPTGGSRAWHSSDMLTTLRSKGSPASTYWSTHTLGASAKLSLGTLPSSQDQPIRALLPRNLNFHFFLLPQAMLHS